MACLTDRALREACLQLEKHSVRDYSSRLQGCKLRRLILLGCADERTQFGAALGSFQLVQEKLARMLANLQAMFLMCWRLSKLYEEVGVFGFPQSASSQMPIVLQAIADYKLHCFEVLSCVACYVLGVAPCRSAV